jgi:hypothetical protein
MVVDLCVGLQFAHMHHSGFDDFPYVTHRESATVRPYPSLRAILEES